VGVRRRKEEVTETKRLRNEKLLRANVFCGRAGLLSNGLKDLTTPYPFRISHIQGQPQANP
jgi:hypothetical protein